MNPTIYVASGFVIALALDIYLVRGWHRYRQLRRESWKAKSYKQASQRELLKHAFYLDALEKGWDKMRFKWLASMPLRRRYVIVVELALIAIWSLIVGRDYLNMDPRIIPAGGEFGSAIQANYLWVQVQKCGWCALWNGSERGGYPAFADMYGSMLHPIVAVTTLIWGVVNGVKVALLISLWLAGVAQWWIARELGLGWLPRIWSAGIAVAGGHLLGRMQIGVFSVFLSTAMASLALAGVLHLGRQGGRRAAVLLGISLASVLLSGQGYMQIGLLGVLPATMFFLFDGNDRASTRWKDFLLASVLGFLLAAPFLVPFLHLSPYITKDMDPDFKSAQSLAYLPLNLIIDDWAYFNNDALGKLPFPYLYTLYIGWIPVLLAAMGLSKARREDRRALWFMTVGAILAFLMGTATIPAALAKLWPAVAGIRYPTLMAGLAVPLILGLSAYGLEYLIKVARRWPNLSLSFPKSKGSARWQFPLRWFLFLPLVLSLQSAYHFARFWTGTAYIGDDVYHALSALRTETLQWVEPPFGEHFFIEPAIENGLKISPGIMTWGLRDRDLPAPVLYASRQGIPPGMDSAVSTTTEGITIYASSKDEEYAAVIHDETQEPCQASGSGGQIMVKCSATEAGHLVAKENMWTGWQAWMDGQHVPLLQNTWLEVDAPAGKHTFIFRYLPWDVPLSLALFVFGIIACVLLWRGPLVIRRAESG